MKKLHKRSLKKILASTECDSAPLHGDGGLKYIRQFRDPFLIVICETQTFCLQCKSTTNLSGSATKALRDKTYQFIKTREDVK